MNITVITTKAGAKPKRKRVGRGESSGLGKTSGRGNKGMGARAGYKQGNLREGGMFPMYRRLPKFGFSNKVFRTEYQVVNVEDLETRFENGAKVNAATLAEAGLIGDREEVIKILGNGQLSKKLTVEAQRFSASAAAKIEAAGGTVTRLGPQPKKKFVKRPAPRPEPEEKEEAGEGKKGKKSPKGEGGKKAEKGAKGEKGGKGEKSEKKSQADAGAGQEGG